LARLLSCQRKIVSKPDRSGTVPLWQCRSFCAALAGQQPHKPAMTVSRSGADHNRSAVSVQKPHRGPQDGAHWA
jgi:hypothetical protein